MMTDTPRDAILSKADETMTPGPGPSVTPPSSEIASSFRAVLQASPEKKSRGRHTERNRRIFQMQKAGKTVKELAVLFEISEQRTSTIINAQSVLEARERLPFHLLSHRVQNRLINNGIYAVEAKDITPEWVASSFDEGDLMSIKYLGINGVREVMAWLETYGLKPLSRDERLDDFRCVPIHPRPSRL